MARILYVWELGEGLGHLMQARSLCEPLARMGHELFFVLRNPLPARRVLGDLGPFFAAPLWPLLPARGPIVSYPALLAAVGFLDAEALDCLARAWRHVFALVRPDLVLADHAPTALLALRGLGIPSVPVGSGFLVPPRLDPMPVFSPFPMPPLDVLERSEQHVLSGLNRVIVGLGAPPLDRCADLFGETRALLAYRELDHYPDREAEADYWGVPPAVPGAPVSWPSAPGHRRIFAYLKPFPKVEALLAALTGTRASVSIFAPGLSTEHRTKYASRSLVFLERAADVRQVASECDLAITHAGIGTVAYVLLAGKPILLLPLQLEQQMLANAVVRLGAGLSVLDAEKEKLDDALAHLLNSHELTRSARAFAARYAHPTEHDIETRMRGLLDSLGARSR